MTFFFSLLFLGNHPKNQNKNFTFLHDTIHSYPQIKIADKPKNPIFSCCSLRTPQTQPDDLNLTNPTIPRGLEGEVSRGFEFGKMVSFA